MAGSSSSPPVMKLNLTPPKPIAPDAGTGGLPTPRTHAKMGPLTYEAVVAQIENVKSAARNNAAGTDQKLFEKLVEDAIVCRTAGKCETALTRCYEVVACVEMNRKAMGEEQKELHAFSLSNLASALHMLGHCKAAKRLYEQAHQELRTAPQSWLDIFCMCADVRGLQLDYIASRAVLATDGHIPDKRTFLDGTGTERMWSDLEIELALPRAMAIEAEIDKNKPPPLNLGSLSGASYKSYPITATPRKELW